MFFGKTFGAGPERKRQYEGAELLNLKPEALIIPNSSNNSMFVFVLSTIADSNPTYPGKDTVGPGA